MTKTQSPDHPMTGDLSGLNPNAEFLTTMNLLNEMVDGMSKLLFLGEAAVKAGNFAVTLHDGIHQNKMPTREFLTEVRALAQTIEAREFVRRIRVATADVIVTADRLLGDILREPNGDLVSAADADEAAISDALYA